MDTYDINKRQWFGAATAGQLIAALQSLPPDTVVCSAGVSAFYMHVATDGTYVCLDEDSLDECYPEPKEANNG